MRVCRGQLFSIFPRARGLITILDIDIQNCPAILRILTGAFMSLNSDSTVGQLVAERPSRARVFERLGIDYCCGGKRPLQEVCRERKLDLAAVVDELAKERAV